MWHLDKGIGCSVARVVLQGLTFWGFPRRCRSYGSLGGLPLPGVDILAVLIMSLIISISQGVSARQCRTHSAIHTPRSTIAFVFLNVNRLAFRRRGQNYSQRIFFNLHIVHAPRLREFHFLLVMIGGELEIMCVVEAVCVGVDVGTLPSSIPLRRNVKRQSLL